MDKNCGNFGDSIEFSCQISLGMKGLKFVMLYDDFLVTINIVQSANICWDRLDVELNFENFSMELFSSEITNYCNYFWRTNPLYRFSIPSFIVAGDSEKKCKISCQTKIVQYTTRNSKSYNSNNLFWSILSKHTWSRWCTSYSSNYRVTRIFWSVHLASSYAEFTVCVYEQFIWLGWELFSLKSSTTITTRCTCGSEHHSP